jgi:2-oxoglutarate ferredoxin oxidoreductase subunit alpha
MPCIFLSDTSLANRTESIKKPDLSKVKLIDRLTPTTNGHQSSENFRRYELTESGISPMSIPGQRGGQYVSTGLEHSEYGRPRYDTKSHVSMTEKRFRKLALLAVDPDLPEAARIGDPEAEIGLITWGSTWGIVEEVVMLAAEKGIKVEAIAPKLIWPLPTNQLDEFMKSKRVIICPEVNYTGQFAELLKAHYLRPIVKVNTYSGAPFKGNQILEVVEREAKINV